MLRFSFGVAVFFAAFGCGEETFDLLPPGESAAAGSGGMTQGQGGGEPSGGSGGRGPSGGTSGTGGGRPAPPPDCPPDVSDCRGCASGFDCAPGETCDPLRNYCAPSCSSHFECGQTDGRPLCHVGRCVECIVESDCLREPGVQYDCDRGACLEVECLSFFDCPRERPVCSSNVCRPCRSNNECGTWVCEFGFCNPPPQPGPGG